MLLQGRGRGLWEPGLRAPASMSLRRSTCGGLRATPDRQDHERWISIGRTLPVTRAARAARVLMSITASLSRWRLPSQTQMATHAQYVNAGGKALVDPGSAPPLCLGDGREG